MGSKYQVEVSRQLLGRHPAREGLPNGHSPEILAAVEARGLHVLEDWYEALDRVYEIPNPRPVTGRAEEPVAPRSLSASWVAPRHPAPGYAPGPFGRGAPANTYGRGPRDRASPAPQSHVMRARSAR